MISLAELLINEYNQSDLNDSTVESTYSSIYDSSLANNFSILRCPNVKLIDSHSERYLHKKEIEDIDFDDNDSGLGDSTPPSPTWSYNEGHDDADIRQQISEKTTEHNSNNIFCWEDKVEQYIDAGKI